MDPLEKQVRYQTTNTYNTLNNLTAKTENIWMVFHGIGYLSRYFLKYFDELSPIENYIIAPQAPSKYYLNSQYRYVGASWLTKENTALETQNVIAYLDAVFAIEKIPDDRRLIVFGYSQGVSIAMRWLARKQLKCAHVILYAGGLPDELTAQEFKFLEQNGTHITLVVGNQDEYLTEERRIKEASKMNVLFNGRAKQVIFEGGHEIKKELLNTFL
ncbi:MAG: esterase [Maribacter sp.]|nr:esterase [Maribacter sp.]